MRKLHWIKLLLPLLTAAILAAQPGATVIVGAMVADGTGKALIAQNVRVLRDRIDRVGLFSPTSEDLVIHAEGLVLAPGFIDTHNHSGAGLETEPGAESQVSQGITTMLLGQDGTSALPIGKAVAVNVLRLAGHASIRRKVMGNDYRRPASPAEISKMCDFLDAEMRSGAVGLSSGLEYDVGSYSKTQELVEMAKVASRHGGIYVSHLRDEGDGVFDAVREAISIGELAKIPVHISHIKMGTVAVWNRAAEVIQLVEDARRRGLDVTADCYPYDAWSSTIKVLVADKKHENRESVKKGLADVGGAQNVTVTTCVAHRDYEFRTLSEIARTRGTTPIDVFMQIVSDGGASVVVKSMVDADIKAFYRQRWVMVGSDGGIGMRHPRGAGTYPRVLGLYVRELSWLTLPEAIRKMTSLPADRLKLADRGRIEAGKKADLVLFDPAMVSDRATFQKPLAISVGIRKVMVNGKLVWDAGNVTGALPGAELR